MLEMKLAGVWKLADEYAIYRLDEESKLFWLFNIQDGSSFDLNKTSYFILSCIDGKTPLSKIHERLLSKFPNEDPQRISSDFGELIDKLINKKVLEQVN